MSNVLKSDERRMFDHYPDILNANDVQEILSVGKDTIYRLLENGDIKSIRIGRIYKIPKIYLEEFIKEETSKR